MMRNTQLEVVGKKISLLSFFFHFPLEKSIESENFVFL